MSDVDFFAIPPAAVVDSVLCGLQCPSCPHIEWCSVEDPDAGQSEMFNHLLWQHCDVDHERALLLLAKCAEVAA